MLEIKAVLPVVLLLCSAIMAFRCRIYVRAPDAMDLYIGPCQMQTQGFL